MFAGQLKPDSLESVTLEAIGAVSGASVHSLSKAKREYTHVQAGELSARIDRVLKDAGPATDQASRDMTRFLNTVNPHLKALDNLAPITDLWTGYFARMLPQTQGPAEALFDKYFKDAQVPADHAAAHVPDKMAQRHTRRRAM